MGCLTENTIQAFIARQMNGEISRRVEAHIHRCEPCRVVLAQMASVIEPAEHTGLTAGTPSGRAPEESNDEEDASLVPGGTLDRYVILERVGSGGMGTVYAAYDPKLDRKVALKLLRRSALANDTRTQDRLLREAQAMARLAHPNVVGVYDFGAVGDRVFLSMELLDGVTLAAWLTSAPRSWRDTLAVLLEAGRGLAAAHQARLVHRDFKPENLLIGAEGRVCVTDFGLACDPTAVGHKAGHAATPTPIEAFPLGLALTQTGTLLGTPAYMAPEQHGGGRAVARSDQFAFCVTAYEALFGERPFPDGSLSQRMAAIRTAAIRDPPPGSRVPLGIKRALVRGLRAAPDERYPSMGPLLEALRDVRARGRRRLAWIAASLMLVGTGAGLGLGHRRARLGSCRAPEQALAASWNRTRSRLNLTSLGAADPVGARHALQAMTQALDSYATDWRSLHAQTCEAMPPPSDGPARDLWGLRRRCLEQRAKEFELLTASLADGDYDRSTQTALRATHQLPRPSSCSDRDMLSRILLRPDNAALAEQVEALEGQLTHARILRWLGQRAPCARLLQSVMAQARMLSYRPAQEAALYETTLLEEDGQNVRPKDPRPTIDLARLNPTIVPPTERYEGGSYADWSARWWQWAITQPVASHPLGLAGTGDCARRQEGPVWFLGGSLYPDEPLRPGQRAAAAIARTCTIPSGTAVFLSVIGTEASAMPGDNCGDVTEAGLRACAKFFEETDLGMRALVDGQSVQEIQAYRVLSPVFPLRVPSDPAARGIWSEQAAAGDYRAVSNGVFLLVRPLPVGMHRIAFYTATSFGYTQDVTYDLNVVP